MEHRSEQINELVAALISAKSEMGSAIKDKKGFNYKYADLTAIMEVCEDALLKNGIFLGQPVITEGDEDYLHTQLLHVSGQWMESYVKLFVSEGAGKLSDHQEWGKAVTYMRRYCLQSLIGIATEDNDGATAPTKQHIAPKPKPITTIDEGNESITKEQLYQLTTELEGRPDITKDLLAVRKINSLSELKRRFFYADIKKIQELKSATTVK